MAKFRTNASGILFSWRDNSSYRLYTLGPLCLWQCLLTVSVFRELNIIISHSGGEAPPHWPTPAPDVGSKVCQILLPGQHLLPHRHLSPDCCIPGTSIHVPHPGKKATLLSPDKGAAKDPSVLNSNSAKGCTVGPNSTSFGRIRI